MATNFTTWTDLYTAMLNAMADMVVDGGFTGVKFNAPNGAAMEYRSLEELQKNIKWVKTMAALESGTAVGRTYAKNGGRGG